MKGFALTELLVVVAFLGIIAAVVIPNIGRLQQEVPGPAHNITIDRVVVGKLIAVDTLGGNNTYCRLYFTGDMEFIVTAESLWELWGKVSFADNKVYTFSEYGWLSNVGLPARTYELVGIAQSMEGSIKGR